MKQNDDNQGLNVVRSEHPVINTMIDYEADLSELQLKWKQLGIKDIEAVDHEQNKYMDKNN